MDLIINCTLEHDLFTYLSILMGSWHGRILQRRSMVQFRWGSRIKAAVNSWNHVDCSVATQQVMLEFCETVGIVGYLSSRDVLGVRTEPRDSERRRHLRPFVRISTERSQRDVTEQNSEQPPPLALPFHSMLKIERKVPFRIEHHWLADFFFLVSQIFKINLIQRFSVQL